MSFGWWARALVIALVGAVAGCGGGGGGGTEPPVPPLRVVASSFANGAIDVDVAAPIVVTFDAPVGLGIGSSLVQLTHGSTPVPATVETSGTGVIVRPTVPLSLRTDYRLTIKAGARANNGATLAADHVLDFKTMVVSFATKSLLAGGPEFSSGIVGVGDVNGDGRADVVVATRFFRTVGGFQDGYRLSIYTQDEAGALALFQELSHVASASAATVNYGKPLVLDVDGDGRAEILVSQEVWGIDEESGLQVYKRADDGQFREQPFRQSRYLRRVLAADVNGDGRLDLVGSFQDTSTAAPAGFQVFLNTNQGLEATPAVDMPAGRRVGEIAVGDLDRDGSVDLAVTVGDNVVTAPDGTRRTLPVVWTYSRRPDGSYAVNAALTLLFDGVCADVGRCEGIALMDIDGDGWLDLVYSYTGVAYLRHPANGFPVASRVNLGLSGRLVRYADLDADGVMDVLLFTNTDFNFVVAGMGQRRPALEYSRAFALPSVPMEDKNISVADYNGDGRPDIILTTWLGIEVMQQTSR